MSEPISVGAPAKVNLVLRVLAREESGYHGLETIFARISLADDLTVEPRPAGTLTLEVDGPESERVGPDQENLAARAAQLVLDATRHPTGVHLRLTKRIPVQSGLGGGSADAAAALEAVNQLVGNRIPRHELLQLASRLGADVPFCLSGARLALGWSHGERLMRLPPLPSAPLLLVTPPVGIATTDAYRWVDDTPPRPRGSVVLDLESVGSWSSLARMAGNDFESPVFARLPEIRRAFEALVQTGPQLCRMSGSGSTLVALYGSTARRDEALAQFPRSLGSIQPAETL